LQNPIVTYTNPGYYSINLTVSNAYGPNSTVQFAYINALSPLAPIASFTSTATTGYPTLTVYFTDTSTNSPTSWYWNVSNGGTVVDSNLQNPVVQFTNLGTYSINETVSNAYGQTSSIQTNYINVVAPQSIVKPMENDINLAFTFAGLALAFLAFLVLLLGAYLSSRPMITRKEQKYYYQVMVAAVVVIIVGFFMIGIGIGTLGPILTAIGG
jgi:hypothetical protein